MKSIILASQSPRRRELLRLIGLEFEAMPSGCEENTKAVDPGEVVMDLSGIKCMDIAGKIMNGELTPKAASPEGYLVVGSDTIVVFEGQIIGKPKDREDAFRTLKRLSGNTHSVYTGVTVFDTATGKREVFYERTLVTFFELTDEEISAYVSSGDPMDKAGSYGVQGPGAFLVKRIEGDYFTVVGLPIARLYHTLKKF